MKLILPLFYCFFLFILGCGNKSSPLSNNQVYVAVYKKNIATGMEVPFSGLALQINKNVVAISSEDPAICQGSEIYYSSQNFNFSADNQEVSWIGNTTEFPDCFPQNLEIKNKKVILNSQDFYEIEILAEVYYFKIQ